MQNQEKSTTLLALAEWRNGRRWGLKIPCPIGRVGSNPTSAIDKNECVIKRMARQSRAELEKV